MKKVLIFISILCFISCGPTKRELDNIKEQSRIAGFEEAKAIYYHSRFEQGYEEGEKVGIINGERNGQASGLIIGTERGIKIGVERGLSLAQDSLTPIYYKKGEVAGIIIGKELGRQEALNLKIKSLVILGVKTNLPKVFIFSISILITILLVGLFYQLYFEKCLIGLSNYCRERRWDFQSKFNQTKRLEVQKEKWSINQKDVGSKIRLFENSINMKNVKIKKLKSVLDKGVPTQYVDVIKARIADLLTQIKVCRSEINKGHIHIHEIQKVKNLLEAGIIDIDKFDKTSKSKDAGFDDIAVKIKDYLLVDIGNYMDLEGNDNIRDDEFIFENQREFFKEKSYN